MILYVDSHIAFEYPTDFALLVTSQGQEYCLRKGKTFVFYLLGEDNWNLLKHQLFTLPRKPESIKSPPNAPIERNRIDNINVQDLAGKVLWHELMSPEGKLIFKGANAFVSRSQHYLHLRVDTSKDFEDEWIADLLASVAFPGEEDYEAAKKKGPVKEEASSPNIVKLRSFARLGAKSRKSVRINVSYEGEANTDAQSKALDDFIQKEEAMFDIVTAAIFQYYTKHIYPLLKEAFDRPEVKSMLGLSKSEMQEILPVAAKVNDIIPIVELNGIIMHEPCRNGEVPIGLSFHCRWDEEHGLGVRMKGMKVDKVGNGYVAL